MVHGPVVKRFLDIEVKVLLAGADGPHQFSDVVGVQSAGLCRQTAGQVCVADMSNSLKKYIQKVPEILFRYIWLNEIGTGRPVTDDITILSKDNQHKTKKYFLFDMGMSRCEQYVHWPCILTALQVLWSQCFLQPQQPSPPPLTHLSCSLPLVWWSGSVHAYLQCYDGNKIVNICPFISRLASDVSITFYIYNICCRCLHRAWICASLHTRDKSSADDNVHILTLFGKQLHLCLYELFWHFLGVASLTLSWLLDVHFQWLCSQRFKLFQSCSSGRGGRGDFLVRQSENEHEEHMLHVMRRISILLHWQCRSNVHRM